MSKLFVDVMAAAELAGLTESEFRNASKRIGLTPLDFHKSNTRFIYLRQTVEARKDELRAASGHKGHRQNKGPRVRIKELR